jgi:hypothetical protein
MVMLTRLGLMRSPAEGDDYRRCGDMFESRHPVGDPMYQLLYKLVDAGVLEQNEDGQYRIPPDFDPKSFPEKMSGIC